METNPKFYLFCILISLCFGCNEDGDNKVTPVESFNYNFEHGAEGWAGDFADYPRDWEKDRFEFEFTRTDLPAEINENGMAMKISGRNISDDLFMFMKKQITGLEPNHTYMVTFQIEIGSQYPEESAGIGGSPGGSVYLKAGGATTEPMAVEVNGDIRMNIDKGNQSQGGDDMVVLGTIGIPGSDFRYELIQRDNLQNPVPITTDNNGDLWIIVGTDSGFEGTTTLYYNTVEVTLKY